MNANSKPAALTNKSWLHSAALRLNAASIPTSKLDAELLLAYAYTTDRTWLVAHDSDYIPDLIHKTAHALLERRLAREPIAYITGHKEFYGRDFIVTPDVLIPRPESETMIDLLKQLPLPQYAQAVDVGTGSGCLGITAKLECHQIRDMILSDISEKALVVAKRNNRSFFHEPKIQYYQSDLLQNIPMSNDVILANLPYVDREWEVSPELAYEPQLALYADDHGLKLIRTLIEQAPAKLDQNGYLLLEADPEQHEQIIEHGIRSGFQLYTTRNYIVVLQKSR